MQQSFFDITPFHDFRAASKAILKYLYQNIGFSLWMMTRVEGENWIVLNSEDHGYNIQDGTVLRWADSFCSQMVQGLGPRVAPSAEKVPAYAAAPIGKQVPIGAYIGVPVARRDGTLFGTLCAIDPQPQNESIQESLPMVELLAQLLGSILDLEMKQVEQIKLLESCRIDTLTDAFTGLLNRHGWDDSITAEEARSKRYGNPACILIIDLDGLKEINDTKGHAEGDALIRATAGCLRSAVRESDKVARLGGDEFAILGVECDMLQSEALLKNVTEALAVKGIRASIGRANRDPRKGLSEAVAEADRRMYAMKAEHHRK